MLKLHRNYEKQHKKSLEICPKSFQHRPKNDPRSIKIRPWSVSGAKLRPGRLQDAQGQLYYWTFWAFGGWNCIPKDVFWNSVGSRMDPKTRFWVYVGMMTLQKMWQLQVLASATQTSKNGDSYRFWQPSRGEAQVVILFVVGGSGGDFPGRIFWISWIFNFFWIFQIFGNIP